MSEAKVKERPILFSGPLVAALLAGRKTVTRRLLKPQPPTIAAVKSLSGSDFSIFNDRHAHHGVFRVAGPVWAVRDLMKQEPQWTYPYGQSGDRLWVRETWALEDCGNDGERVIWQADREAAWVQPGRTRVAESFWPAPFCKAGRPPGQEHAEP